VKRHLWCIQGLCKSSQNMLERGSIWRFRIPISTNTTKQQDATCKHSVLIQQQCIVGAIFELHYLPPNDSIFYHSNLYALHDHYDFVLYDEQGNPSWQSFGAAFANSNKCEEALVMYTRALQIKPKYARAWFNMAISYSNLNQYDEAARCCLQTLSLNPTTVHCWSYLRIALS
jgi:tetratricopeptide (TPR) repeat protein